MIRIAKLDYNNKHFLKASTVKIALEEYNTPSVLGRKRWDMSLMLFFADIGCNAPLPKEPHNWILYYFNCVVNARGQLFR